MPEGYDAEYLRYVEKLSPEELEALSRKVTAELDKYESIEGLRRILYLLAGGPGSGKGFAFDTLATEAGLPKMPIIDVDALRKHFPVWQESLKKVEALQCKMRELEAAICISDQLKAYFRTFDNNGDGVINKEEFKSHFDEWSDSDIEKLWTYIDRDSSGFVQYDEFVDWISGFSMKGAHTPPSMQKTGLDVVTSVPTAKAALLQLEEEAKEIMLKAARETQVPAGRISEVLTDRCIDDGRPFIFDSTLKNILFAKEFMCRMLENGYTICLVFIDTDISVCRERVESRYKATLRPVPDSFVHECNERSRATVRLVNDFADLYIHVRNNTEPVLEEGSIQELRLTFREIKCRTDAERLEGRVRYADLLHALGYFQKALPVRRETLEARERTLGGEHQDTLKSVNDLARTLYRISRTEEAEALHRRALEARERTLGEEHQDTLMSVNYLANLLKETGRIEEAEAFYRRALEAQERTLGEEHQHTLRSVNNLAILLKETGRIEEAEALYR